MAGHVSLEHVGTIAWSLTLRKDTATAVGCSATRIVLASVIVPVRSAGCATGTGTVVVVDSPVPFAEAGGGRRRAVVVVVVAAEVVVGASVVVVGSSPRPAMDT